MTSASSSDVKFEIGHVLFIDIVGYSKLLIDEQRDYLRMLNEAVRETDSFRAAEGAGKLTRLPTGDGMALVFATTPDAPVSCALQLSKALRSHPEVQVRMGIHSGPVSGITDVNDRSNVAGAGINLAQRVMDCGDAGHILLSRRVAEDLEQYRQWQPCLHDLGECEVKHGTRVHVFNLYTDGVGNPEQPEKLKQRDLEAAVSTAKPTSSRKYILILIAAALIIAALAIGGFLLWQREKLQTSAPAIPEKSIAVLPFENLSRDPENAYFADGIQDEILSTVGKVGDLKVISRTSAAKYKTRPENLRQVGMELGAAHVLEGSVQKAGERVRVIVQLIDTLSDAHLWSETYDRELKDIFSVQSDIAQSIAIALKAKLPHSDKESLDEAPTRNAEAYQSYLEAGYFAREATARNGDPATLLPQALELYGKAVAKDPSFALAWAQISYVHSWMHWYSVDDSPERVRLAEEAAERAISLNSHIGETHLAAGYAMYWGKRDYAGAMKHFEVAHRLLPNSAEVAVAVACVLRRLNQWDAALDEFKRAASLDPRDNDVWNQGAWAYSHTRRYTEALEFMDRALTIQPDYWDGLCGSAMIVLASSGDVARANAFLARLPASVDPQGQVRFARWRSAMWSRDFATAVAVLEGAPDWIRTNPVHRPVATAGLRGMALEAAGKVEAAQREFQAVIPLLEAKIKAGEDEPSIHAGLGRAYAALGRKDEAVREGMKAVDLLPVTKDSFDGPFYLTQLAEIHARVGNADEAITILRQLLDMSAGVLVSPALLRLDPAWDPIRSNPRFEKIVASVAPKDAGPK